MCAPAFHVCCDQPSGALTAAENSTGTPLSYGLSDLADGGISFYRDGSTCKLLVR